MPATPSRRCRPACEELEPRTLLSGFQPTAFEQLFLEDLNDARANPPAYGQSIGLDLSNVAPSQPLAFNPLLVEAARLHSQDMNDRAYFAHVTPDGITPAQREAAAGFVGTHIGESIAAGYSGPAAALAGLIIDADTPSLGHRTHLLNIDPAVQAQDQLGIGIVLDGSGPYTNYYTIDTAVTSDTRPFLCGVVFHDDNGNGKYDVGEGYGGVALTVQGAGATTTFSSGGYSLQVNPGTYTVTASGGGLAAPITQTVTVGSSNVRLNFSGAPEGSWNAQTAMPVGRSALAAVAGTDGRIYAVGGADTNSSPLTTTAVYDPTTNAWTSLADMPTARISPAAARGLDGLIYVFGGQNAAGNPLTAAEAYNPNSNSWATLAPLPRARTAAAAVTGPDGHIYLLGGASGAGSFPAIVDVYDPATNTWSTAASLPTPRVGLAAVLGGDGRLFALGGDDSTGHLLPTVEVYTPATSTWAAAASMPDPRAFFAAATGADGRIYVIGGDVSGDHATTAVYTPVTDSWSTLATLGVGRTDLAAALGADGRIYAIGGHNTGGVFADVQALTVPVQFEFATAVTQVAETAGMATVWVVRTGSSSGQVTVHYSTAPGTATADTDYTPRSGTLTFQDGQTSQSFTVPILDDGGREDNGTVTLVLDTPSAGMALANPPSAVLLILENDPLPQTPPPGSGGPGPTGNNGGLAGHAVADVSTRVRVARMKGKHAAVSRVTLTLRNVSGADLAGPLSLVLTGLPRKRKLRGASGLTQSFAPGRRPYLNIALPGGVFRAGATLTVTLSFSGPGSQPPFRTQVLAGSGPR
jgi:uncharacterized protein YkwD/N-acetylneuraminic acid mutarotase